MLNIFFYDFYSEEDAVICAGQEREFDSCDDKLWYTTQHLWLGGPMLQFGENCEAVQWGIVSWGIGCSRETQPGIYTSIAKYIDWIQSHLTSSSQEFTSPTASQEFTSTSYYNSEYYDYY